MSRATTLERYLDRYAEPEARCSLELSRDYEHVLVVPTHDERPELLHGFDAAFSRNPGSALLLLVANSALDGLGEAAARTRTLVRDLRASSSTQREVRHHPPIVELTIGATDILLVDRTNPGFELGAKQGVGLARRIGSDVALRLILEGRVKSPFIASTDADVSLPRDYFETIGAATPAASALLFPFSHVEGREEVHSEYAASDIFDATLLLECSLRYLVLGLAHAGSPYAFHTIGSTLVVSAQAYAEVRGFPDRLAGEDFHLLNKLAKVAPIVRPQCAPIQIRSRVSSRTPFGTGMSVQELLKTSPSNSGSKPQPRAFYHPAVFLGLRAWFEALEAIAEDPELFPWQLKLDPGLPTSLCDALVRRFSEPSLQARLKATIRQHRSPEQRLQHLFVWFDALRIVQLIRLLNDACPPLPWREALHTAPFIEEHLESLVLTDWVARLRSQEATLPRQIGPTLFREIL